MLTDEPNVAAGGSTHVLTGSTWLLPRSGITLDGARPLDLQWAHAHWSKSPVRQSRKKSGNSQQSDGLRWK